MSWVSYFVKFRLKKTIVVVSMCFSAIVIAADWQRRTVETFPTRTSRRGSNGPLLKAVLGIAYKRRDVTSSIAAIVHYFR